MIITRAAPTTSAKSSTLTMLAAAPIPMPDALQNMMNVPMRLMGAALAPLVLEITSTASVSVPNGNGIFSHRMNGARLLQSSSEFFCFRR